MEQGTLLPDTAEVELLLLRLKDGAIHIHLRSGRDCAACPRCKAPSRRVHSRYIRRLADLPWEGLPVSIHLRARKFFCVSGDCPMRVFTERLENTAPRYARRTQRSAEALDWIALALGGQAGSRLALHLGLPASGSTLLRLLRRRAPSGPVRAPRVLGIDEWAWRKGHRYGTILCDLEAGTVVHLLPDREAETVAHWLRTHPGVEIVSRDRASAYAEAARRAAPQAVQVADRWHVLRNLSQALTAALEPHHRMLTQAALAIRQPNTPPASVAPAVDAPARTAVLKRQNRERRHGRYERVLELAGRGKNKRQIARELGLARRTVRRWLHSDGFPERQQGCRSSTVDVHATYLDRRWEQGCHNAAQLWRELRERGFGGQQNIVRRWIRQRRGPRAPRGEHPVKAPAIRVSPRRVAWWLLTEPDFARPYLDELYRRAPHIAATASVAREFVRMVRERGFSAWSAWLQAARTTPPANFATYLARDQDAVLAALRLPWNNGPVEGQVHRLKLIKRQMYGRANFDLLRLRVLNTV